MVTDSSGVVSPSGSSVVIPLGADQFRDFITGLLGRPQTIWRTVSGPFDVTKKDVSNLYHLIDQRVSSQNLGGLVNCRIEVGYDDESSVELRSIEDFDVYNEVRPQISKYVHLSLTYLLQFQGRKFPEKQEITVLFSEALVRRRPKGELILHFGDFPIESTGTIAISIGHTDRSWGTDIQSLIVDYVSTLRQDESPTKLLISRHSTRAGWLTFGLLLSAALVGVYNYTGYAIDQYLTQARLLSTDNGDAIGGAVLKLDFLIQILASGLWTRYAFYVAGFLLVSLILSIGAGIYISDLASQRRPSFVALTERAKKRRDKKLRETNSRWIRLILSVVGAVSLSIVGNIAFAALVRYWPLTFAAT